MSFCEPPVPETSWPLIPDTELPKFDEPPAEGMGDPHLLIEAPAWSIDENGVSGNLINFAIDDNIGGSNLMFFGCIVNSQEFSIQYTVKEFSQIPGGWFISGATITNGGNVTTLSAVSGVPYINGLSTVGTSFSYDIGIGQFTFELDSRDDGNFNMSFSIYWKWLWSNQGIIDRIGGAWWYINRHFYQKLSTQSIPPLGSALPGLPDLPSGPTQPNIDGIGTFLSDFDISPPITSRSYFETATLSGVSDVFNRDDLSNVISAIRWMQQIPIMENRCRYDWDPLADYTCTAPAVANIDDPFNFSI